MRGLELVTEALLTQGGTKPTRKPARASAEQKRQREILAAITNLADNYHGVHTELAAIRQMMAEQATQRQRDWEELHRRMAGLHDLINLRQRQNDDRADRLGLELEALRADLHQLRIEAQARLNDAEARLHDLDGKGPAARPTAPAAQE